MLQFIQSKHRHGTPELDQARPHDVLSICLVYFQSTANYMKITCTKNYGRTVAHIAITIATILNDYTSTGSVNNKTTSYHIRHVYPITS